MSTSSRFLNVDLEIESRHNLKSLLEELGGQVVVLHSEAKPNRHFARIESSKSGGRIPDKIVHHLCAALENLSPAAQKSWTRARSKVFDFGYDVDWERRNFQDFHISARSLKRISDLGGSIAFSCYNYRDKEPKG